MLRKAQEILELNQNDFGTYMGVSSHTINNWMTGRRKCHSGMAEMTLRLAELDAERLENGEPTSGMMRWALIESYGRDEWMTVFGSKADAIRRAKAEWDQLQPSERKNLTRFEVSLVRVQITDKIKNQPRFSSYCDESGRCDADAYETEKDWIR